MDRDFLARRVRRGFEGPGGFVEEDGVGELALYEDKMRLLAIVCYGYGYGGVCS